MFSKRSVSDELVAISTKILTEASEYQAFFKKALKKFGATSPDALKGDKKKEFYAYVDKNWNSEGEAGKDGKVNEAVKVPIAKGEKEVAKKMKAKGYTIAIQVGGDNRLLFAKKASDVKDVASDYKHYVAIPIDQVIKESLNEADSKEDQAKFNKISSHPHVKKKYVGAGKSLDVNLVSVQGKTLASKIGAKKVSQNIFITKDGEDFLKKEFKNESLNEAIVSPAAIRRILVGQGYKAGGELGKSPSKSVRMMNTKEHKTAIIDVPKKEVRIVDDNQKVLRTFPFDHFAKSHSVNEDVKEVYSKIQKLVRSKYGAITKKKDEDTVLSWTKSLSKEEKKELLDMLYSQSKKGADDLGDNLRKRILNELKVDYGYPKDLNGLPDNDPDKDEQDPESIIALKKMLGGQEVYVDDKELEITQMGTSVTEGKMGLHIIGNPAGTYSFVGNVPGDLAYVGKDGKPLSPEQKKRLKGASNPSMIAKSRSFKSKEEAQAAAKSLGFKVDSIKESAKQEMKCEATIQRKFTSGKKEGTIQEDSLTFPNKKEAEIWLAGIQRKVDLDECNYDLVEYKLRPIFEIISSERDLRDEALLYAVNNYGSLFNKGDAKGIIAALKKDFHKQAQDELDDEWPSIEKAVKKELQSRFREIKKESLDEAGPKHMHEKAPFWVEFLPYSGSKLDDDGHKRNSGGKQLPFQTEKEAREFVRKNRKEAEQWKVWEVLKTGKRLKYELDESVNEASDDKAAYQAFFQKALKKFGAKSPDMLKGDKKKEFYAYIDKNWNAEHEAGKDGKVNESRSDDTGKKIAAKMKTKGYDTAIVPTNGSDMRVLFGKSSQKSSVRVATDYFEEIGSKYKVMPIDKYLSGEKMGR